MQSDLTANSPTNFLTDVTVENVTIEYCCLREICQGGPVVGNIKINGRQFPREYDFGGPLIIKQSESIFIPLYDFKRPGFALCLINVNDFSLKTLTPLQKVIWISHLDGDLLYFYEDLSRTKLAWVNIISGELHANVIKTDNEIRYYHLPLMPFVFIGWAIVGLYSASLMVILLVWSTLIKLFKRQHT